LVQHSAALVQTAPWILQQVWLAPHCMPAQQSSTEVHAPRAGTQQLVPSQVSPAQQSPACEQVRRAVSQQRPSGPQVAP